MTEFPLLEELLHFVNERWAIHVKRGKGAQPPWTNDPILQKYRFTNVRREDDRVTKWIHERWLRPHKKDPNVWFAMIVARLINKPEALEEGGYPIPWRSGQWAKRLDARKARGETCFSSAYMIRGIEANGATKVDYLADQVLTPLWIARKKVSKVFTERSLQKAHACLLEFYGLGSFLAGQIIADAKWVEPLRSASDWTIWAAVGPGSARGLNRVMGRPINEPWKQEDWHAALLRLRKVALPKFPRELCKLDAQNFNNILCETDKMLRAKSGEGRPKQLYPGGA